MGVINQMIRFGGKDRICDGRKEHLTGGQSLSSTSAPKVGAYGDQLDAPSRGVGGGPGCLAPKRKGLAPAPSPSPWCPVHTPLPEQRLLSQLEGRECQWALETSFLPLKGQGGLQTSALSQDAG